jgi:hypothetical protein
MLGTAMYTTIKTLRELGKSKSEIARLTGHDWKTVSKVIKSIESGQTDPKPKERESIVAAYKEKVIELLEKGLSGVRIHEELTDQGFIAGPCRVCYRRGADFKSVPLQAVVHSSGNCYRGTYSAVKKYIRKLKRKEDIFVRVHTVAGQEGQVDFGYVGRILAMLAG